MEARLNVTLIVFRFHLSYFCFTGKATVIPTLICGNLLYFTGKLVEILLGGIF